ncbi:hypothetical protein COBT_002696, partial [Conglomerata obtusa]
MKFIYTKNLEILVAILIATFELLQCFLQVKIFILLLLIILSALCKSNKKRLLALSSVVLVYFGLYVFRHNEHEWNVKLFLGFACKEELKHEQNPKQLPVNGSQELPQNTISPTSRIPPLLSTQPLANVEIQIQPISGSTPQKSILMPLQPILDQKIQTPTLQPTLQISDQPSLTPAVQTTTIPISANQPTTQQAMQKTTALETQLPHNPPLKSITQQTTQQSQPTPQESTQPAIQNPLKSIIQQSPGSQIQKQTQQSSTQHESQQPILKPTFSTNISELQPQTPTKNTILQHQNLDNNLTLKNEQVNSKTIKGTIKVPKYVEIDEYLNFSYPMKDKIDSTQDLISAQNITKASNFNGENNIGEKNALNQKQSGIISTDENLQSSMKTTNSAENNALVCNKSGSNANHINLIANDVNESTVNETLNAIAETNIPVAKFDTQNALKTKTTVSNYFEQHNLNGNDLSQNDYKINQTHNNNQTSKKERDLFAIKAKMPILMHPESNCQPLPSTYIQTHFYSNIYQPNNRNLEKNKIRLQKDCKEKPLKKDNKYRNLNQKFNYYISSSDDPVYYDSDVESDTSKEENELAEENHNEESDEGELDDYSEENVESEEHDESEINETEDDSKESVETENNNLNNNTQDIVPMLKPRICELDVKNLEKFKIFALDIPNLMHYELDEIFENYYGHVKTAGFFVDFKNWADSYKGIQICKKNKHKLFFENDKYSLFDYINELTYIDKIYLKYIFIHHE